MSTINNPPIFVISGIERRQKKKELNSLKCVLRYWNYNEDLAEVYGHSMLPEDSLQRFQELISEKDVLEAALNEKINPLKIKTMFTEGQELEVVMVDKLPGKEHAPELKMGERKTALKICLDSKGNQHIDVGLVSKLSYVTSFETGEELPEGHKVHWCHPSRFKAV